MGRGAGEEVDYQPGKERRTGHKWGERDTKRVISEQTDRIGSMLLTGKDHIGVGGHAIHARERQEHDN